MRRVFLLAPLLALALLEPRHAGLAAELPREARWLQAYLRLDTTNPPGNEHRAASYLQSLLRAEGVASQLLVTPAGRTSLHARLRAEPGVDGPALVLLHHMDVVAPGPGWTHPPFGGVVAQGRLWGRGALDAKSLGIAHLAAFLAVHRQERPLARDLVFLAVPDEELGGLEGAGWLLERHPELFVGVEAVLNEGGAVQMVSQRVDWWGVEVAQKRPLWLQATVTGRGGHAAGFHPQSPPHALIAGLGSLLELPYRYRVTPPVQEYLAALAELHDDRHRPILAAIDQHISEDGPLVPLMPGMENLFLDTVQVTVLEGAGQVNVVPSRATARIDVRMLPDTDSEELLARLRGALGRRVELEVLLSAPPAPASPSDHPVYQLLERVLGREGAVVPFFSSGFTDSRFFRERGIPAYGVMPFALEPQELMGIHGADESIPVAELMAGARRMEGVARAWALGQ